MKGDCDGDPDGRRIVVGILVEGGTVGGFADVRRIVMRTQI